MKEINNDSGVFSMSVEQMVELESAVKCQERDLDAYRLQLDIERQGAIEMAKVIAGLRAQLGDGKTALEVLLDDIQAVIDNSDAATDWLTQAGAIAEMQRNGVDLARKWLARVEPDAAKETK